MSFNLTENPCIPVFTERGSKKMSLYELFENLPSIKDILGAPVEEIAIFRLLLCITQAALKGPTNEKDWSECKEKIQDTVLSYLKKKKNCFNLYGPKAFLQIPDLKPIKNREMNALFFKKAVGQNHTLFDFSARDSFLQFQDTWSTICTGKENESDIAIALTVYQQFVSGGLIKTEKEFPPPIGVSSEYGAIPVNVLLSILKGKNLLETLYLNLITKDKLKSAGAIEFGKPVWELNLKTKDIISSQGWEKTYLFNLVPLTRSILLEKDSNRCTVAGGLHIPNANGNNYYPEYRDPMGTIITKKDKEKIYLPINLDKAPWRELHSILNISKIDKIGENSGPWAFSHIDKKENSPIKNYDSESIFLWTGGLSCSRAKIVDNCSWNYEIDLSSIDLHQVKTYGEEIEYAEKISQRIYRATKIYFNLLTKKTKKKPPFFKHLVQKARRTYWAALESKVDKLIIDINEHTKLGKTVEKDSIKWWKIFVKRQAIAAFKKACMQSVITNPLTFVEALSSIERSDDNE
jgi:CRISPR system Cascade subunit CasA